MYRLIKIDNIFFLAIFGLPLYLIRFSLFGLPTNILEVLAILAILSLFFKKREAFLKNIRNMPLPIFISGTLLLSGLLLSILFNNNYRSGFGILKGWFLLPMLFAYGLYLVLDLKELVEKALLSFYFSAASIGTISLFYKIAGNVTYDNRLEAFYSSPNYLAMYFASATFFGFYFLVKSFQEKHFSQQFFVHAILLIMILIPLYLTYSYGALVAILMSLLIVSIVVAHGKTKTFLTLFAFIVGLVFILQANSPKFLSLSGFSERSSWASRTMVWKASLLMIKDYPVLGIGPGNFQTEYLSLQKHFPPYLEWAVPQPHNIFLAFWLQTGILGLIGFLWLLLFIFRILFNVIKNNKKDAALAAPLLGFFIYTLLHGLVDTPYWKNDLSFIFWICIALTVSIKKFSEIKNRD